MVQTTNTVAAQLDEARKEMRWSNDRAVRWARREQAVAIFFAINFGVAVGLALGLLVERSVPAKLGTMFVLTAVEVGLAFLYEWTRRIKQQHERAAAAAAERIRAIAFPADVGARTRSVEDFERRLAAATGLIRRGELWLRIVDLDEDCACGDESCVVCAPNEVAAAMRRWLDAEGGL